MAENAPSRRFTAAVDLAKTFVLVVVLETITNVDPTTYKTSGVDHDLRNLCPS